MSNEQAVAERIAAEPTAAGEWDADTEELPPRPRRRLLAPVPVALLSVLLLACGFIGGVLVEKGQTSSSTGGGVSGLASRFAALRAAGGASAATAGTGAAAAGTSAAAGASTGGAAASFGGGAGSGSRGGFAGRFGDAGATIGEVSYVDGTTLYVSDAEGDTVKVTTSAAASITKTVKTGVHGIHPGETVVVRGSKNSRGVVSAESISIGGGAGAGGAGLAALFGGGAGRGGAGASAGGETSGGGGRGGQALFGG
jgi:hypothetical protein